MVMVISEEIFRQQRDFQAQVVERMATNLRMDELVHLVDNLPPDVDEYPNVLRTVANLTGKAITQTRIDLLIH